MNILQQVISFTEHYIHSLECIMLLCKYMHYAVFVCLFVIVY